MLSRLDYILALVHILMAEAINVLDCYAELS